MQRTLPTLITWHTSPPTFLTPSSLIPHPPHSWLPSPPSPLLIDAVGLACAKGWLLCRLYVVADSTTKKLGVELLSLFCVACHEYWSQYWFPCEITLSRPPSGCLRGCDKAIRHGNKYWLRDLRQGDNSNNRVLMIKLAKKSKNAVLVPGRCWPTIKNFQRQRLDQN